MVYKVAERFKSLQGEGVYTGTPMAFIRFVGCSVGKKICQHCDTDFDKVGPDFRGGGEIPLLELRGWADEYQHICLTGGEPLDQNLQPILEEFGEGYTVHIETSGTKDFRGLLDKAHIHAERPKVWTCVSPKPGFLEDVVMAADEVKVIVPGLGEMTEPLLKLLEVRGPEDRQHGEWMKSLRWPTLEDALRWAHAGKVVFLQPRNAKFDVDKQNLLYVQDVLRDHPELRLSVQMHKVLKVQ